MTDLSTISQIGISSGLGALVGLQRQWVSKRIAGVRTFSLVAAFGAISAILSEQYGSGILVASLVCLGVCLLLGNLAKLRTGKIGAGFTTEIAAFVTFLVGVLVVAGMALEATVVGAGVAVILQWKRPLHKIVKNMGEADLKALTTFVLIALVILPLLPDQLYGPYEVLNPFKIWLLVVLIVGISFAAYVCHRFVGANAGILLGGALGGLISSTATTVTYSERSKGEDGEAVGGSGAATAVIIIASMVVFGRVLFEIHLVAPNQFHIIAPPVALMMGFMGLLALAAYYMKGETGEGLDTTDPPSALKTAITFGFIYAVVLFALAAAKEYFGDSGLFVVGALSGLTDMDAITLSVSELSEKGGLNPATAWKVIMVGGIANILFKGGIAFSLGSHGLKRRVIGFFSLAVIGGAGIIYFY